MYKRNVCSTITMINIFRLANLRDNLTNLTPQLHQAYDITHVNTKEVITNAEQ